MNNTVAVQYVRNFAVGRSSHVVRVYRQYDDFNGLDFLLAEIDSTKIADCVKLMKSSGANNIQIQQIKVLAKDRSDGIILDDGSFKNY